MERKRLKILRIVYFTVWILLWFTQRTFEYQTINQRADTNQDVQPATRFTLLSSNALELIMELVLYGWLIRVSFILSRFLKSFEATEM